MRLARNPSNNAVCDWSPELAKYELSPDESRAYLMSIRSTARAFSGPPPTDPDVDGIVFHTSAQGIGDAVTCLYAACGIANAGYKVTYYTKHMSWLARVSHPNLTLLPLPIHTDAMGANCNLDYPLELKAAYEGTLRWRSEWKMRNLVTTYRLTREVTPSRPDTIAPPADPVQPGKYIVLAPCSLHAMREWHIAHWARLAKMLKEEGLSTVILCPPDKEQELRAVFPGLPVWCKSIDDALNVIENCALFVGNDSGPAHISALLRKRTICIQSTTTAEHVFYPGKVTGVYPNERETCRFCYWQSEGGIIPMCASMCSALATISSHDVKAAVLLELGKTGTIAPLRKRRS